MTDHANIHAALLAAQQEFEPAHKTSRNDYFKSNYADLQACMDAVGPALSKHGILPIWRPEQRGDDWVVVFVLHHVPSATELLCSWPVIPTKNDPQGFASGSTYARRYSLMALTGLAPEDDDGNAASRPAQPSPAEEKAEDLIRHLPAAILQAQRGENDTAQAARQWIAEVVLGADCNVRRALAKHLKPEQQKYLADLRDTLKELT